MSKLETRIRKLEAQIPPADADPVRFIKLVPFATEGEIESEEGTRWRATRGDQLHVSDPGETCEEFTGRLEREGLGNSIYIVTALED